MGGQEISAIGDRMIVNAKDWTGDDDLENPRNFSIRRKVISTLSYTFLAFVSTLAASIYSAGTGEVTDEFQVSEEVAVLPLALYNLGLAFGPLIGSPLSETAGRKTVIMVTTPLFAIFTLGAGFSPNIVGLIVCRFFAGVFAAPAISNASATITDYVAGADRAIAMSFYYAIPTFGALLGPLVGGFIVLAKGWRWTQWVTIFLIIAFYIPVACSKETYKKTILQRRAKKLGIEGPLVPNRSIVESIHYFATILIFRPIHMLLTEPIVSLVCLYSGFLFGLIYTFIVASPWVYEHYYGFQAVGQSLSFIPMITGTLIAPIPLLLLDRYTYQPKLKRFLVNHSHEEVFPPEYRLYGAMIASPLLPAFLLAYAWTSQAAIYWICPMIFQCLAMCMSSMIYTTTNLYMMDTYGPLYGASAAGAAMLSRYSLSTAFPLFSLKLYRALGVGWATTILALATVLMAPIPWIFHHYGHKVRVLSKYETSA